MDLEPVEFVFGGVFYALEILSFMLWVCLEATKFSLFGMSTAARKQDYERVVAIWEQVGRASHGEIWWNIVMYSLPWLPSWSAYYCFYYFSGISANYSLSYAAHAKKMIEEGYHLNEKRKWVR